MPRRAASLALMLAACNAGPGDARAPVTVAIANDAPPAPPPTHAGGPTPSDDPLADAVGATKLTPREREEWGTYVNDFLAPCASVATSVAQCLVEKRACAACAPAARFLLRAVRAGRPHERVERDYKRRFDPSASRPIGVDGSPTLGPSDARVTVVVFSDFECPACGFAAPRLDAAVTGGRSVRLVYKFVALAQHAHAEIAARAAIAAHAQGKFWEMHKMLFSHQSALEERDLEGYARAIGLDMKAFLAAMKSRATTARIETDAALWHSLQLHGTPSVFVEGRELESLDDLDDWIADFAGG